MFRVFDTDGSGFLDHSELKRLVTILKTIYNYINGGGSVESQVEDIMKKIDCNNDGSISVYEFIEQGKAIGLLDPLTHLKGDAKGKSKVRILRIFKSLSFSLFYRKDSRSHLFLTRSLPRTKSRKSSARALSPLSTTLSTSLLASSLLRRWLTKQRHPRSITS
jgi:hypothetical protein